MKPRHAIEADARFMLKGWVAVPAGAEETTSLLMRIDGSEQMPIRTRIDRLNVQIDGEQLSRLKFSAIYPPDFYDGKPHRIEVLDAVANDILFEEEKDFQDLQLATGEDGRLVGAVYFVARAGHIEGWALDPADPQRMIAVDLIVDGARVAREMAHLTTPNMLNGGGRHGFRIQIPNAFVDNAEHEFAVVAKGVALPAIASTFRIDFETANQKIEELSPFYARFDDVGFEYLTGVVKADARGRAHLALYDGETSVTRIRLEQTIEQGRVRVRFRIPDELYDGSRRALSVRLETGGGSGSTVIHRATKIMAPKLVAEARAVDLAVKDGRLRGGIVIDNDWALEGGVGLFVNGVRVASEEFAAHPGGWGEPARFDLDIGALASLAWVGGKVELTLLQPGARRIDVGAALLGATTALVEDGALTLRPAVPLTGAVKVELARANGEKRTVEIDCVKKDVVVIPLTADETAESGLASVALGGQSIALARTARAARPSPQPRALVIVSEFATPDSAQARKAIDRIRFAEPYEATRKEKGKATGAWELSPPHSVVGWAVDIENPDRTLSVSVLVDGTEFGPFPANRSTSLVAPGVEIARGFEIDLGQIDVPAGMRTVEVRFAGSGVALHPQVKVQLLFAGRSETAGLVEEVDRLVDAGLVDEALVASSTALDNPALALRHLVLDAMARRDWSCHAPFVNRFSAFLQEGQLAEIKALKPAVTAGDVAELHGVIGRLDLPAIYANAFADLIERREKSGGDSFAAAFARWMTTSQRRKRKRGDRAARIALVDLTEEGGVTSADERIVKVALSPSTRAALAQDAAVPDAAAQELRDKVAEASWALFVGRPRAVPADVGRLWANAAESYDLCDVTVIPHDAEAGSSPARELDRWSAFVATGSPEALVEAARAAATGRAHGLLREDDAAQRRAELVLLTLPAEDALVRRGSGYLLIHDFPEGMDLPVLPASVHVARGDWSAHGGLPTLEQIVEIADREGADWAGGVIVLSSRIAYPSDYLVECVRHYERSLGGVAFHGMAYDDDSGRFEYAPYKAIDETSIGLLPLGCFPIALLKAAQPKGPIGELRIVHAEQPIRVVSLRGFPAEEERDQIIRELSEGCSPAEHQAGFVSALRERHHTSFWRFQDLLEQPELPGLTPELRLLATELGLASAVGQLERGQIAEAQDLIRVFFRRVNFVSEERQEVLKLALVLVRLTGQQSGLMEVLLPCWPDLVQTHSDLIIDLFENAAFVLEPEELSALVIACADIALAMKRSRATLRLLDISQRYCSERVMLILLSLIDRSERRSLLADSKLMRSVGNVFALADEPHFRLARTQLNREHFRLAAAPELRLTAALTGGRRTEFLQVLNELIAQPGDLRKIARLIRTYTNELSQFAIRGREVIYPTTQNVDEVIQLALILGDLETASTHMEPDIAEPGIQPDPLRIVWRSSKKDYSGLNDALAVWYGPYGIAPVELAGEETCEFFSSAFKDHGLAQAESFGKVSIICTVFNPDVPLLKVALASMLTQTYQDVEVLLVDDGSASEFTEAIAEAATMDPRIRYLRLSRNAGPYHGRNVALEIATGDFVAIHDGDDIAHPQRLEFQVRSLVQEPTYQMSTVGHLRIDMRGQVQFEHTLDLIGDGTMTSFFRRSLFDKVGGFADVRSRGDVEFRERVRRTFGQHVISHTAVPLLFCLAFPGSLSNHTAARYGSYLALYRDGFAKRLIRQSVDGRSYGSSDAPLQIPHPLRSTTPR